jgi:IclR family transcriptional regulator, pca regulon regulatory protein
MNESPPVEPLDAETDDSTGRSRDFVQSLERGLSIMRVFSSERPSMTVSEVAQQVDLTRATVRRFLLTLSELGYVKEKFNRFELTPQVLELGYAYLSALSFPEVALPKLEELVALTGESSEAAILDRGDAVYVARVAGPALLTISVNIGARRPAHATSLGRAMLAYLPEEELETLLARYELKQVLASTVIDLDQFRKELAKVREQGYAVINQELEEGLIALAVPVRDRSGAVLGAINISTHIGRKSVKDLVTFAPVLQKTAAEIESGLRFSPNAMR